ncbi:MAG TPA: VWA domain-containing protein, partial [Candidatus Acidoferrum sp.]
MFNRHQYVSVSRAILLVLLLISNLCAAQEQKAPPQQEALIRVSTEVVLVNVIARDKHGNLVRDLKKEDFTVLEDGQKQQLSSFDFENVDELALANQQGTTVSGTAALGSLLGSAKKPVTAQSTIDARDRRLVLMFFDLSAMQPDDIDRSVDAAKKYVQSKMQPADLVGLVSLDTDLKVDLDFTDDRTKLLAALSSYNSSEGQGFENGATG